jgi:hypothetical protein
MGYRGKLEEQEQARVMRAEGMTLLDIATRLGVSKSSVSLWCATSTSPRPPRRYGPQRRPHLFHEAKLRQIEAINAEGVERMGILDEGAFLAAGAALYAGEGAKTEGEVRFANTDPEMVRFFCAWLRRFFEIDETRLRVRVYLHQGLDLEEAHAFWSEMTQIPIEQFREPYRAIPDPSIRRVKHEHGCVYVGYCCSKTHRQVMGLVRALLSFDALPG